MYKIFIVDDDALERMHIIHMLDWESLQCEIIGEAFSVDSALIALKEHTPDIVITDMSMPDKNGVHLVKYIADNYPGMSVIVLSAYDNFEFVHDSLKFGAIEYLLKHQLTEEVMQKLIRDTIRRLEKTRKPISTNSPHVSSGNTIADLLSHDNSDNHSFGFYKYYLLAVGKTQISSIEIGTEKLKYMDTVINETFFAYDCALLSEWYMGRHVLLLASDTIEIMKILPDIIRQAETNIIDFTGVKVSYQVSSFYSDIHMTSQLYHSLSNSIENAQLQNDELIPYDQLASLDNCIREHKWDDMVQQLNNLFSTSVTGDISISQFAMIIIELSVILKRNLAVISLEQADTEAMKLELDSLLNSVYSCSIKILKANILKLFYDFIQTAVISQRQYYNESTKDALMYILDNYSAPISLKNIANKINVNSAYLSRQFKKETGINVVRFLNQVRMTRAKELIDQKQLLLKEIPFQIGIDNYIRFYQLYKEHYGLAPSEE